ncbi:hydrogenase maturation protease [Rubrobacter indicoceani]|uniref:hydrogenase maturation protease n=1 Tax=Rubrobacter indicoceani TaxID=2051957 RepID=UPI000E5C107E|nr:hydrogenase maturation protease [Rubrobacter indicoceani]
MKPHVLVAGMGNDLRQDDGFGIAVVRRYEKMGVAEGVVVYEAGIAGIGLVQELMDGYEALVIVDATDRGEEPGTVFLLEVEVPETEELTEKERQEFLADTHLTVPSQALTLARALGILPRKAYILGCQPKECGLGMELSEPVERGVAEALERLRGLTVRLAAGRISS